MNQVQNFNVANIINPKINTQLANLKLQQNNIVSINGFLTADYAEALYNTLLSDTPWSYAYFSGDSGKKILPKDILAMDFEQLKNTLEQVKNCGPHEYQFLYQSYMIVTAYLAGENPGHFLHQLLEFFNSAPFIGLMKQITGCEEIIKIDAQATSFTRGSFIKEHNDADTEKGRRFAYVLSMTKDWLADWGGLLHFTENGQVTKSFVPAFNRLTIFEVPQKHFVSQVTSYAGENRFSITGWMYDK